MFDLVCATSSCVCKVFPGSPNILHTKITQQNWQLLLENRLRDIQLDIMANSEGLVVAKTTVDIRYTESQTNKTENIFTDSQNMLKTAVWSDM